MGTRYAIYYVPFAKEKFYQTGSHILGYDIRRQMIYSRSRGPTQYFGFHATLRGIFKTKFLSDLDRRLLSISENQKPITIGNSFLSSFNQQDRVILFKPDLRSLQKLFKLHTIIVSIVDGYRQKDYVSPEIQSILGSFNEKELDLLKQHGDPRVLRGYIFHFTLANQASPSRLARLDKDINRFQMDLSGKSINIDSLCLVAQEGKNPYWKIIREYLFRG
jgi:Protein of unknown function (DUF1045)